MKKRRKISEPEEPVAKGFWGKPPPLQEAKNEFLCIQATLCSTLKPPKSVTLSKLSMQEY